MEYRDIPYGLPCGPAVIQILCAPFLRISQLILAVECCPRHDMSARVGETGDCLCVCATDPSNVYDILQAARLRV
jgi:hypothetical protein